MPTSTDIVNQAIQLIGDNQPLVTGTAPVFDSSPAGKAAAQLYAPTVAAVARQFGWDFARHTDALALSGNVAPGGWAFEYLYPAAAVQVWSLLPTTIDANDPLPYNFNVANAAVGGSTVRVIHSNLASASAVYNSNPNENAWDASFRQAVVNLLASVFAMALAGKLDAAKDLISEYGAFEKLAEGRQD